MSNPNEYTQAVDNRYVARVQIGESFTDRQAVIKHIMDDPLINEREPYAVGDILGSLPSYTLTEKRRDTTVGGNEAINSYYQFNENDDLIHPINRTGIGDNFGMGRVYNETFDEQQQVLYLSFGLAKFTDMVSFMKYAYDSGLALLMNTGDMSGIEQVGRFLGNVLGTVVQLPFIPIRWALDILANHGTPATGRYFDFRQEMVLYYKMVNVILAHLAVNMDLAGEEELGLTRGASNLLQTHGIDILTILNRKNWYDQLAETTSASSPNTDQLLTMLKETPQAEANGWAWWRGMKSGFTESLLYVGFRVEKSSDSSETATNTTKETDIARLINAQVSGGRDRTYNLASIKETAIGQALNTIYKGVESVVTGTAESFNVQGATEILKGSGYMDFPEVWDSSSFSKSYTFDFQLRTPYGDKFSIFQSLYIPLAMLIAGSFPRAVGSSAYTSPFLVRAYCQGMFAIPLGIIDSITIKRGSAEYGWSKDMLPTQIDVSFTIKDLSPIMYVALSDSISWKEVLGQNTTFQEYMLTLAGTNVAQRTLTWERVKARTKALLKIYSNNKFNTLMQGFAVANTTVGRAIAAFWPVSKLPGAPKPNG